jgi:hypothetical protein
MSEKPYYIGFLTLFCAFLLSGTVFAQTDSLFEQENAVKSDLKNLYQQWRKDDPASPVNYMAFRIYLEQNLKPVTLEQRVGFIGVPNKPRTILPSGGWLIELLEPKFTGLMGFWVDINGQAPPNSANEDQQFYIMDSTGAMHSN